MVARLTIYENVDLQLADRLQQWVEGSGVVDPFGELPGYRGSMTLVDRDNARMIGIGFYASPGQAQEADAMLAGLPARARAVMPEELWPALELAPESVGLYEIAHRD